LKLLAEAATACRAEDALLNLSVIKNATAAARHPGNERMVTALRKELLKILK